MKELLTKIGSFFESMKYHYIRVLEAEISNECETLLDVGCGSDSPIRHFSRHLKYTVGVDAYEPAIAISKERGIHDEYKVMNVLDLDIFPQKSFDCVLAASVIEHLPKKDGYRLISMMERIARKKIIILTPNGFLPQSGWDENPYQQHLSGWDPVEMKNLGFRVVGVNGWKQLRGERSTIRWRPHAFWLRVSMLSQYLVQRYPQYAFEIICVKELG